MKIKSILWGITVLVFSTMASAQSDLELQEINRENRSLVRHVPEAHIQDGSDLSLQTNQNSKIKMLHEVIGLLLTKCNEFWCSESCICLGYGLRGILLTAPCLFALGGLWGLVLFPFITGDKYHTEIEVLRNVFFGGLLFCTPLLPSAFLLGILCRPCSGRAR